MTNISNEIIPYAFYFVALIFFVASIKIKPKKITDMDFEFSNFIYFYFLFDLQFR